MNKKKGIPTCVCVCIYLHMCIRMTNKLQQKFLISIYKNDLH